MTRLLSASAVEVVGWVDDAETYPIAKKRHTFEYLRGQAHLRPRTNTIGAITRVRTTLANAIHNYFHERDFHWINTPIITGSDCEGAGELFRVSTLDFANLPRTPAGEVDFAQDFFAGESFLTVSGQLEVESYCLAMSKVYTFGPTFRAERSKTRRHLLEFWMVEPEVAFMTHEENMALQEELVSFLVARVLERRSRELEMLGRDPKALEPAAEGHYPRLTYKEAVALVNRIAQEDPEVPPLPYGEDFGAPHEAALSRRFDRPVFVERYPARIKAFYMEPDPEDPELVLNDDLLAPEGYGEIIGGSQRIHDLELLRRKIQEFGLPEEVYDWYLDLRRFGSVPHSGFGLGLERTVAWICGLAHVREAIPFPRMYTRMRP